MTPSTPCDSWRLWSLCAAALLAGISFTHGCSSQDSDKPAVIAELYSPAHFHEVSIELDLEDWKRLCEEAFDYRVFMTPQFLDNPPPRPYSNYKATVTIDGERFESVGVRKKGFLGSVNTHRPALKIDLEEFKKNQSFRGERRITLQNSSPIEQYLATKIYREAGVPVSRFGFAKVTVNGQDMGLYGIIEPIRKPFLKEHFGNDEGNLYEARLSDFRPEFVKTFERKTNEKDRSRDDLHAVTKALESEDEQLLSEVDKVVDIDKFIRYWATTALVGAWDSYPGSSNNYHCYRNPKTRKFEFMPWSPDSAFHGQGFFSLEKHPNIIYANGHLCRRLWGIPEIRERYRKEMQQLLADVWREDELLAELDRLEPQTTGSVARTRVFIKGRRSAIEAELAGPAPDWPIAPEPTPLWTNIGNMKGRFSFTVKDGVVSALQTDQNALHLTLGAGAGDLSEIRLIARPSAKGFHQVFLFHGASEDKTRYGIVVVVPKEYYATDGTVALDGNHLTCWPCRFELNGEAMSFNGLGLTLGSMRFQSTTDGQTTTVVAEFDAMIVRIPIP